MKNNSYYFKTITGIALFLFTITGIQAQECPQFSYPVTFDWSPSTGSGNEWLRSNQNTGDSQTYIIPYTDGQGDPQTVSVTMTLQDPDGANGDGNFVCPPEFSTGGGVGCNNYWTETNGVYGSNYLTMGVFTLNTTESFTLDFEFSYPATIEDWEIHDIDDIIRPGTNPGGGDGGGNVGKANSYQDEIMLTASYLGSNVPITITPKTSASDIEVVGQTARAVLDYTDDNNVLYDNISPSDTRSHVYATAASVVDKWSITYKNGPDEIRPTQQTYDLDGDDWVVPAEVGWSDGHAIRIPGFTFCITDGSVPVELSSFTAQATMTGVQLDWRTESEFENLGFTLERKTNDGEFVGLTSYKTNDDLLGQGTVSSATDYAYLDQLVEVGNTYKYRLADVDHNGVVTYHSTRVVTVEQAPLPAKVTKFTVLPAYPNPFNPSTTIRYALENKGSISIAIYDITGKLITTLLNSEQTPGWHSITWNGTNQHGEQVPAGLYLNRITSGNEVKTNKLMLLK